MKNIMDEGWTYKDIYDNGFREGVASMQTKYDAVVKENDDLRKNLSDLCPIADLTAIDSLRMEKLSLMEEIEEVENDARMLAEELRLEQNPGYSCNALREHDARIAKKGRYEK